MKKEQLTRYRYSGPLSGVTLRQKQADRAVEEKDVQLIPGAEVDLPADHPYVRKLAAKKHLTEVVPDSAAVPDQPAPKPDRPKSATAKEDTVDAG